MAETPERIKSKIKESYDKKAKLVWAKLRDRKCFEDPEKPKALKINIHLDLIQILPEYSENRIISFLRWWTRRDSYRAVRALAEAGEVPRYDLWGNECPSGPVAQGTEHEISNLKVAGSNPARPTTFTSLQRG